MFIARDLQSLRRGSDERTRCLNGKSQRICPLVRTAMFCVAAAAYKHRTPNGVCV